jgi:hypothetical protein
LIVTVLPHGPSLDAPKKPKVVAPEAPSGIVTGPDKLLTLSLVPSVEPGQLKLRPPAVTVAPGVRPTVASSWAEYASLAPSKVPNGATGVTVSFVVPMLL